jgi:hypothetical protein
LLGWCEKGDERGEGGDEQGRGAEFHHRRLYSECRAIAAGAIRTLSRKHVKSDDLIEIPAATGN